MTSATGGPTSAYAPPAGLNVPYKWAAKGDINAFFGLMLDNVMNLVILAGILIFVFGFPEDLVYRRMFPGTALGVMFGSSTLRNLRRLAVGRTHDADRRHRERRAVLHFHFPFPAESVSSASSPRAS